MQRKEAKTILSTQNGLNPYRTLTRGSLLDQGFDSGSMAETDYESVEAKINAPSLLSYALRRKRNKCMIMAGSQSDPYQPCEKELKIMRGCLEEIDRHGFGLAIQTKSDLVLRDLDLLTSINRKSRCIVQMTLMTVDEAVRVKLEPNVCTAARRTEVLTELKKAGIPTIVRIAPVLPFLNDSRKNIEALMEACIGAGIYGLGFEPGVTVREKDRESFLTRLEELFPGMRSAYEESFGTMPEMQSPEKAELLRYVRSACAGYHIEDDSGRLFTYLHAFVDREAGEQLSLFDIPVPAESV